MSSDHAISVADTAARLHVTEPRVSQLLNAECPFTDPPVFELESPEGHPVGTTHVFNRTITLASIEAYEERHPVDSGKRKRHPPRRTAHTTAESAGSRASGEPRASDSRSSVQTLRLQLEHQLEQNRILLGELQTERDEATERVRELKHQLVDLQANLDLKSSSVNNVSAQLTSLKSTLKAYGEVFTQDVGPQDTSEI